MNDLSDLEVKFLSEIKACVSKATDYDENIPTLSIPCILWNTDNDGKVDGTAQCLHKLDFPRYGWLNDELTPQQRRTCHDKCEHCVVDENLTLEPILFKDMGYNKITMLQEDVNLTLNAKKYVTWLIDKLEEARRYINELTLADESTIESDAQIISVRPPNTLCRQIEPDEAEVEEGVTCTPRTC